MSVQDNVSSCQQLFQQLLQYCTVAVMNQPDCTLWYDKDGFYESDEQSFTILTDREKH